MNSIIQCITHTRFLSYDNENLINNCTKIIERNDFELMQEWLKLQKALNTESDSEKVNPIDFYRCFAKKIINSEYTFVGFEQNDAGEFMIILFDLLHKCLEYKIKLTIGGSIQNNYDKIAVDSINYWKQFFEKKYSYLVKSTFSQLLSITNCPKCDYSTHNHDPIQVITLPMKPYFKTIYDLLSDYTDLEVVVQEEVAQEESVQEEVVVQEEAPVVEPTQEEESKEVELTLEPEEQEEVASETVATESNVVVEEVKSSDNDLENRVKELEEIKSSNNELENRVIKLEERLEKLINYYVTKCRHPDELKIMLK